MDQEIEHPLKIVIDQMKKKNFDGLKKPLCDFLPGINISECYLIGLGAESYREYCGSVQVSSGVESVIVIEFVILESYEKPHWYTLDMIKGEILNEGNASPIHFKRKFRKSVQTIDAGLIKVGAKIRKWYKDACGILLLEAMDGMT